MNGAGDARGAEGRHRVPRPLQRVPQRLHRVGRRRRVQRHVVRLRPHLRLHDRGGLAQEAPIVGRLRQPEEPRVESGLARLRHVGHQVPP